jgi:hypothetical protein
LQQKELVIVTQLFSYYLHKSFTLEALFSNKFKNFCKIIQFALKSTGFYVNIITGILLELLIMSTSSDPSRIELRPLALSSAKKLCY